MSSFSDPPTPGRTDPLYYFRQYVTDDMITSAVEQSNVYSLQKDDQALNLT